MAIHYRLLQNKIKGSKNYGKYYAHTVKRGVVSLFAGKNDYGYTLQIAPEQDQR